VRPKAALGVAGAKPLHREPDAGGLVNIVRHKLSKRGDAKHTAPGVPPEADMTQD
jgi:hypothetical protein